MMQRRNVLSLGAMALIEPFGLAGAWAQDLPNKTITVVVGFAAGGAADLAARVVARKLSENLGSKVVVDNRPGAGGNIAHQAVARAEPDGSIILLGSIGPLSIAQHLQKIGYDPQKDLAPLTMGVVFPNVLVVPTGVGAKTVAEFVALGKKQPGKLTYASTGSGSASHLAGELFAQMAGVEMVHIPYKGGAPALTDLLGGRVDSYFSTYSTAQPHIDAGKLVPLATTGLVRPPFLEKLPTMAESGFAGFNALNWYAFVAPGKTPAPLLARWNQELLKVLNAPDVKDELLKHGLIVQAGSGEELARVIEAESLAWGKLIRERKISAE
ncbi:MAG: tripartite tricarboxylate transporter substrate binding protein [Burkholderiaceae bacterium]